jgi:hypothetical protein
MVVYLDKGEEVDRLLAKMTVEMANGEWRPLAHSFKDFSQQGATVAGSMDIYTIVAKRQRLSMDSVPFLAILLRLHFEGF